MPAGSGSGKAPGGEPDPPPVRWLSDERFEIEDVEYGCSAVADIFASEPHRFCLRKTREEVSRYVELVEREQPRRIFEAGIYRGGSTALLAQLARPEKLIAIDLEPEPPAALIQFVEQRGLGDSVVVRSGVDQGDREQLDALLAEHLRGTPLDLVIDDASHLLPESRATLQTLLPHVRPGGLYVLEDWSWAHAYVELWPEQPPLTALVLELAILSVRAPGVISSLEIDRGLAIARRGEEQLEPGAFAIDPLLGKRGREMVAALERRPGEGGRRRRWRR